MWDFCGIPKPVLCELSKAYNLSEDDLFAALSLLRYNLTWPALSNIMRARTKIGWSERSCERKVARIFVTLSTSGLINLDPLTQRENDLSPLLGKNVIGSIDTVPVYCEQERDGHLYQPKYSHAVWKFIVLTSHTGFGMIVCGPFLGSEADNQVLAKSKILERIPPGSHLLADCAFSGAGIVKPVTAAQFSSVKVLKQRQYVKNSVIAFFRSRIEHFFGKQLVGRFRAFKGWTHKDPEMLAHAFRTAAAVVNFEQQWMYSHGGRYPPLEGEYRAMCYEKIQGCTSQLSRYGTIESDIDEPLANPRQAEAETLKRLRKRYRD